MPSYVRGRAARSLTDAEIIAAYVRGEDGDTIGMRAGCSGTTVREIVRNAGEVVRGRGARPRKKLLLTDEEIARRYRSGQTGATIGDAAGCDAGTVYKIVRAMGGHVRPRNNVSKHQYAELRTDRYSNAGKASAAARRQRKADEHG